MPQLVGGARAPTHLMAGLENSSAAPRETCEVQAVRLEVLAPLSEIAKCDDANQGVLISGMLISVDVAEVFSPLRVTLEAATYGLVAGESWGKQRTAVNSTLIEKKPSALMRSPPCTTFCQLQSLKPNIVERLRKWDQ